MKKQINILIGILFLWGLILTGCNDNAKIAQEIANLKRENQLLKEQIANSTEAHNSHGTTKNNDYVEPETNEMPAAEKHTDVGEYEVTDEEGIKWIVTLNADKTVQMHRRADSNIYYGSWGELINPETREHIGFHLDFDFRDCPVLYFKSGKEKISYSHFIEEEGFYADMDAQHSKNPKKRLSMNKIK